MDGVEAAGRATGVSVGTGALGVGLGCGESGTAATLVLGVVGVEGVWGTETVGDGVGI